MYTRPRLIKSESNSFLEIELTVRVKAALAPAIGVPPSGFSAPLEKIKVFSLSAVH